MKRYLGPLAAAVAWTAVLVQMVMSVQHGLGRGESILHALVDYFSYFTVTTNTLVALVITVPMVAPASAAGRWLARPHVSAIAASSILVVAITYHLLLSGSNHPVGVEYATDLGLHYIVPPLFALHWLTAAPKKGLTVAHLPLFAIYPLAYVAWILGRGEVMNEYPYFFVDASKLGLLGASRNALGLVALYYVITAVLFLITRKQRTQEPA